MIAATDNEATMENTPILNLPLIMPSQAQQHVTHNEALMVLDRLVQLSVIARNLTEAPGDPSSGDRYIVAAGATGDWAGWDLDIAFFLDGAWMQLTPAEGWLAWVREEDTLLAWDGAAWTPVADAGSASSFSMMGINSTADSTERFTVKADQVFFSHDDVTPGDGNICVKANKEAAANSATLLFQDGWSGRAELGLAGDDDFRIKVSADGSAWADAIVIDRATGAVSMPNTASPAALLILTAEGTSGTSMPSNTYVSQSFDTTSRNDFGSDAWNGTTFTAPASGVYDFSAVLAVNGSPSSNSMYFYRNGAAQLGFSEIVGNGGQNTIASRAVLSLAAGDTVAVRMRHDDPSTQAGLGSAVFSIVRLA